MPLRLGRPAVPTLACLAAFLASLGIVPAVRAQTPPALDTLFPPGGQAGQVVEVTVSGAASQPGLTLAGSVPGFRCETAGPNRFRLHLPADIQPGTYDVWTVSDHGVSAPRPFIVGTRLEIVEAEPNESSAQATTVPLDTVVNGKIDKPGDADFYRFTATRGQRFVIECSGERIDSRLRAVLELFDSSGRRLAVNRGFWGVDPLIDFRVPADDSYVVKIQDLVSGGSAEHYYRLDIDTRPRVAFCVPAVVERHKPARVTLYGWNLSNGNEPARGTPHALDQLTIEIPATAVEPTWPLPIRLNPASAVVDGFAYHLSGSHASIFVGVTDVPVAIDRPDNHAPSSAQPLTIPCEVSGLLSDDGEQDWYALDVRRGEVLYFEGLGQRIQSPVDLEVSVLDATGQRELSRWRDEVRNVGGPAFPTNHLDPSGRWVAPSDGRFLVAVRNLTRGPASDPRRIYRLGVRREEPEAQLIAVARAPSPTGAPSTGPAAINVRRGGRELVDVLAIRRRGYEGPIRIVARDLPTGVECPDVWLGPGVDRGTLVVSAEASAAIVTSQLQLEATFQADPRTSAPSDDVGREARRIVRSGVIVRAGTPLGWGRLSSHMPLAVVGEVPLRITANAHEPLEHHLYGKLQVRHSPGGVVDVAIDVERRDRDHQAPVKLTAIGLADGIANQTAVIPAGADRGYFSLYLPPNLPLGRYSFVVQAETTVPRADKKPEPLSLTVFSNPVTFDVEPAAFLVQVDPFAPKKARRGETIQIRYSAQRRNGFIGKMHTELAVPGKVTDIDGLRGRGETFVGQTESGSLQIVINDDAPLGPQPFLRLFTVGVVEDQPTFYGSSLLPLEIAE